MNSTVVTGGKKAQITSHIYEHHPICAIMWLDYSAIIFLCFGGINDAISPNQLPWNLWVSIMKFHYQQENLNKSLRSISRSSFEYRNVIWVGVSSVESLNPIFFKSNVNWTEHVPFPIETKNMKMHSNSRFSPLMLENQRVEYVKTSECTLAVQITSLRSQTGKP